MPRRAEASGRLPACRRPLAVAAALVAAGIGGPAHAELPASKPSATHAAAILPLRGTPALLGPLATGLDARQPAGRDPARRLLVPRALRQKLGAVPSIAAGLAKARSTLGRAEQAALHMKRPATLAHARAALAQLRRVHARHHAAALVARAHIAEGLALLLHPAAPEDALRAFRRAYAADPSHHIAPDSVPSRTARLLNKARASAGPPRQPAMQEMARLAAWAGVARLVWVDARAKGSRVTLVVVTYDRGQRTLSGKQRTLTARAATPAKLAALVSELAEAPDSPRTDTASAKPRLPLAPTASDAPLTPTKRPGESWYRKWWVWTLVGAVAAGSAVAITVAVGKTERSYTFEFARLAP